MFAQLSCLLVYLIEGRAEPWETIESVSDLMQGFDLAFTSGGLSTRAIKWVALKSDCQYARDE